MLGTLPWMSSKSSIKAQNQGYLSSPSLYISQLCVFCFFFLFLFLCPSPVPEQDTTNFLSLNKWQLWVMSSKVKLSKIGIQNVKLKGNRTCFYPYSVSIFLRSRCVLVLWNNITDFPAIITPRIQQNEPWKKMINEVLLRI